MNLLLTKLDPDQDWYIYLKLHGWQIVLFVILPVFLIFMIGTYVGYKNRDNYW